MLFWTPLFSFWTPHFGWTPRLKYILEGREEEGRGGCPGMPKSRVGKPKLQSHSVSGYSDIFEQRLGAQRLRSK